MFGLLNRILFFVFLSMIGIVFYFWSQKERLFEEYLSNQLGQKVKIEKIILRPDHISIHQFALENPNKSSSKKALTIEEIQCHFSFFWFLQKKKELCLLTLIHPHLNLELYNHSGIKNNWSLLFQKRLETNRTPISLKQLIVKDGSCNIFRQKKSSTSHFTIPDFSLFVPTKKVNNLEDIFLFISFKILTPLTEHLSYKEILQGFPDHKSYSCLFSFSYYPPQELHQ